MAEVEGEIIPTLVPVQTSYSKLDQLQLIENTNLCHSANLTG